MLFKIVKEMKRLFFGSCNSTLRMSTRAKKPRLSISVDPDLVEKLAEAAEEGCGQYHLISVGKIGKEKER
jgi:hypothetical protein